jgi:hypothetical protein
VQADGGPAGKPPTLQLIQRASHTMPVVTPAQEQCGAFLERMRCFSDSVGVLIDTMSKVIIHCILPPSAVEHALQNGDVVEAQKLKALGIRNRIEAEVGAAASARCIPEPNRFSHPTASRVPARRVPQAKSERGEAADHGGGRGGANPPPPTLPFPF